MIKQLAWNIFKNTGDINTYLELIEVENLEKKMIANQSNLEVSNIEIDKNIKINNDDLIK